jgi:hypothetical protein
MFTAFRPGDIGRRPAPPDQHDPPAFDPIQETLCVLGAAAVKIKGCRIYLLTFREIDDIF